MFTGRVAAIGSDLQPAVQVGDHIASLVSLSLTPLRIDAITALHLDIDQVDIVGQAILFESGIYARLPTDMSPALALAVLDVAGAPAQTAQLVRPGDTVVVIGAGGKSGLLCLHEAKKRAGITGQVIAVEYGATGCQRIRDLNLADTVLNLDATQAIAVMQAVAEASAGRMADLVINCVNLPGTEMASILSAKTTAPYTSSAWLPASPPPPWGRRAGKEVTMIIGNGYTPGHADIALQVLRENQQLRQFFDANYAR